MGTATPHKEPPQEAQELAGTLPKTASSKSVSNPSGGWNVDFGEAERPPAEFSGEARQAGYWNGVGYTRQDRWPLRDLHGRATQVSLSLQGGASWVQCLDGDRLGPLLRDGVHGMDDDLVVRWHNLPAGAYALFVYAKPNCQAQDTWVGVPAADPPWQCQELDAQGQHPQAVAFHVAHSGNPLEVWIRPAGARAEARLAGMQLVPLAGEPGRGVLFDHRGVRLSVQSIPWGWERRVHVSPERFLAIWSWGPWYAASGPCVQANGWESLAIGARRGRGDGTYRLGKHGWQSGAYRALVGTSVWGRLLARNEWATWSAGRVRRWSLP